MVDYRLRDELLNLYICLYNPFMEEHFTIDTLQNFITACAWQIKQGEQIKRFPFHIAPTAIYANEAIEEMRRLLQTLRKDTQTNENNNTADDRYSWGYSGRIPKKPKTH